MPPAIPRGVADYFGGAAQQRRHIEATLRTQARAWAYNEIIPPLFEYAETLTTEMSGQAAEDLYRFFDREGRVLALRPDLTIPTARIIGSKLYDQPLPQRYFYAGPVFRYEDPRAGRQREFWQAGVELVGISSADADAEVLALAALALQTLGISNFRFSLGHLGYFHGLLAHLNLDAATTSQLQNALDRKSADDVGALVDTLSLSDCGRHAVLGLLDLVGPQGNGILARARDLACNATMHQALDRLQAVEARLAWYGVKSYFDIDLADVRAMDYYTGITFKAYTPGIGFSVVNGGRYDNLIGEFGPDLPAVGCAFYIDRLLLAQTRQMGSPANPQPDLLIFPCDCGQHVTLARQARAAGLVVALALDAEDPRHFSRRLHCHCNGTLTLETETNTQQLSDQTWLAHLTPPQL
jgi:ATP phosphoribosyltransferase regulatory subunit